MPGWRQKRKARSLADHDLRRGARRNRSVGELRGKHNRPTEKPPRRDHAFRQSVRVIAVCKCVKTAKERPKVAMKAVAPCCIAALQSGLSRIIRRFSESNWQLCGLSPNSHHGQLRATAMLSAQDVLCGLTQTLRPRQGFHPSALTAATQGSLPKAFQKISPNELKQILRQISEANSP